MNHCGSCTACCKVFAIPEVPKPAGKWCQHCDVGVGCKIYEQRPKPCVEFECLYLQSQRRGDIHALAPELRPDRCKVVFHPTTDEDVMAATTMPNAPDAWKRGLVRQLIDRMVRSKYRVVIGTPASTRRIMLDQNGQHEVRMTEPDERGMQWNIPYDPTKGEWS